MFTALLLMIQSSCWLFYLFTDSEIGPGCQSDMIIVPVTWVSNGSFGGFHNLSYIHCILDSWTSFLTLYHLLGTLGALILDILWISEQIF